MSYVVVVEKNENGKIELTKEELKKMLDDAYSKGYSDGRVRYETITYPNWYTTTSPATITLTNDVTNSNN